MPKPKRPQTILETALKLHDKGLWVVPCNGKGAIWPEWQKKKRSRNELVESLKDTKLNIALVLNQCDWIDIECDSEEAEASLQRMFDGEIPPTPTWQSRRGKHRLFLRPEGLPHRKAIELEGVEFHIGNGKGANAVIPPSVHPKTGKRYRWVNGLSLDDLEPAELPQEIVDRLCAPAPKATAESSDGDRIPEGKRNDILFAKAAALKQLGLAEETIAVTLLDLNERLCDPPLSEKEVRSLAHSAATGESKAKVGFLARLLRDVELWHDENDEPFITLPQGDHRENWMIGKRSRAFRRWLSKMFYDATGEMLGASDLSDIASLLEGKAVFDSPRYKLFRRTAEHKGKIYLDLCDDDWQAVAIDNRGWRVVSDPPVKFRRAKAMQSLPAPLRGGSVDDLRRFVNVRDVDWPLLITWLVAALRPVGPYPVLKLLGEQGAAKTTTARALRALVDPNAAPVRAEPRSTRDLMIAANNGWVLCLDNLSTVKPDLSDALCRLATGGGFATRTLYTDEDETIFDAQRPTILTSIEEIGTRSDLLERSLIIELPSIREKDRLAEKPFWREFEKVRPRVLGALLDAVSGGLRRLPGIERKVDADLPRLADFHVWGQSCESSLGLQPGTFVEAYAANLEAATQIVLESSPLISALLRFLKKNPEVEGTAAKLLETLGHIDPELRSQPGWPKSPRVLSAILKRAAPNLRQVGITAEQDTRGGGNSKEKIWRICGPSDPAPRKKKSRAGSQGRKGNKKQNKGSSGLAEHLRSKSVEGRTGRKGRKTRKSISEGRASRAKASISERP